MYLQLQSIFNKHMSGCITIVVHSIHNIQIELQTELLLLHEESNYEWQISVQCLENGEAIKGIDIYHPVIHIFTAYYIHSTYLYLWISLRKWKIVII
jgi:hypothetical protein